jgi:hypothetical protein
MHKILILCALTPYNFRGYEPTWIKGNFNFSQESFSTGMHFIPKHPDAAKTNLNIVTDVRHATGQQTRHFAFIFTFLVSVAEFKGQVPNFTIILSKIYLTYSHVLC